MEHENLGVDANGEVTSGMNKGERRKRSNIRRAKRAGHPR